MLAYTGSHECEALSMSMMTASMHSKAAARDEYVAERFTPILNAMVTDVFREMPDELPAFLHLWVEARLSGKRLDFQGPSGGHPCSASERSSYRTRVLVPVLEPLSDAVIAAMPECPLLFMRFHLDARKVEQQVSIICESSSTAHVLGLDDRIPVDDAEYVAEKSEVEREATQEVTKQEGAVEAPTRQIADENAVAIAEKQVDGPQERAKIHAADEQAAGKQAAEHAPRLRAEVGTPPKHASGHLCDDVDSESRDKEDASSKSIADDEGAQTNGEVFMNHRASCPVPRGHVRDYVCSLQSGSATEEPQGKAA